MRLLFNKIFLEHNTGAHPENRKRLECFGPLPETTISSGEKYLELVHPIEYIDHVKKTCLMGGHLDPDTVVSGGSYTSAVYAVGAAVMACETQDFALIRPPGHHAYPSRAAGFCLFNNIAIAVKHLVQQGKRVMVLDFDGHLGDGTETIFYDTDQVLFWSLHQFPAFPYKGSEDEIGTGQGKGFTMNVCLPEESGDDVYWKAINHLLPVAQQFNPDVVAVSAGFDAHHADPLLELRLSLNMYYKIGVILRQNFSHIFAVLEGGYHLEYLPKGVENFLCGINNQEMKFHEPATDSTIQIIDEFEFHLGNLEKNLSKFWKI